MIETAVDELAAAGARHIVGLVLAPHYSAFSVGQYLGRAARGGRAARHRRSPASTAGPPNRPSSTSSPPMCAAGSPAMPANTKVRVHRPLAARSASSPPATRYPDELRATAEAVAAAAGLARWSGWAVAWQSAGRTPEPWIGPDILAVIDDSRAENADGLLVCPCGFVADHLEVLYDLDIEARPRADERGLAFDRTASSTTTRR